MDDKNTNQANQAPETPAASQPQSTPTYKPNGNKKLPIIIGAAAVVLLAGIGVLVYFLFFSGVSKADYESAYTTTNELAEAYGDVGRLRTPTTESQVDENLDTVKSSQETFDEKYDELESMKAVKRDDEAKELFKAIQDKRDKVAEAYGTTIALYEDLYPITRDITSSTSAASGPDAAVAQLQSTIDKLNEVESDDQLVKDYVAELIDLSEKMIDAVEAYADGDRSKVTEINSITRDLRSADTDFQGSYRDLIEESDISDDLEELRDYLDEKAEE